METIHFKTVDPVSQELLRDASRKGLGLNWERYEEQQPQDGFLRLGLSCPYGCMQGPCRIDPYGRGADRGICGLDRDGMTAAFLLRLTLQGVMETTQGYLMDQPSAAVAWPAHLKKMAAATFAATGGAPLSLAEIPEAAALLSRPAAAPETLIRQAIRLALLGIGRAARARPPAKTPGTRSLRIGYGLLAGDAILIGMTGRFPNAFVEALLKETALPKNRDVKLISLGDWIPAGEGYLPIACTSGEAELLLSAGNVNLVLAGAQSDPGLLALAAQTAVPVLPGTLDQKATAVLRMARSSSGRRGPSPFAPDAALIGEAKVSFGAREVKAALGAGSARKIALIGGADTLSQSLGHLPVELTKALIGEGYSIAAWGDAALWAIKQDLPVGILAPEEGPLNAISVLVTAGKLADLKAICFTGLRRCRDLSFALGLAALGMKVSVAVPLPLWGSEEVRAILKKNLAASGGVLAHFDHPAQADEILDWFLRSRRTRQKDR
jgi:hypothetical protein